METYQRRPENGRIPALDALRGLLALIVVSCHIPGIKFIADSGAGLVAVSLFFAMSGYVLMRAYDDRPAAFVVKRVIRLWPLYAATIIVGYAVLGKMAPISELLWSPKLIMHRSPVDSPAWTLFIEIWMTPILLPLFWIAKRRRFISFFILSVLISLGNLSPLFFFAALFSIGINATQLRISWPKKFPKSILWLGDISYSLYLTHWVVLLAWRQIFDVETSILSLPVLFAVAWAAHRWIEVPSIAWSRAAGNIFRKSTPEIAPLPTLSS